jgi:hypothetical protein
VLFGDSVVNEFPKVWLIVAILDLPQRAPPNVNDLRPELRREGITNERPLLVLSVPL